MHKSNFNRLAVACFAFLVAWIIIGCGGGGTAETTTAGITAGSTGTNSSGGSNGSTGSTTTGTTTGATSTTGTTGGSTTTGTTNTTGSTGTTGTTGSTGGTPTTVTSIGLQTADLMARTDTLLTIELNQAAPQGGHSVAVQEEVPGTYLCFFNDQGQELQSPFVVPEGQTTLALRVRTKNVQVASAQTVNMMTTGQPTNATSSFTFRPRTLASIVPSQTTVNTTTSQVALTATVDWASAMGNLCDPQKRELQLYVSDTPGGDPVTGTQPLLVFAEGQYWFSYQLPSLAVGATQASFDLRAFQVNATTTKYLNARYLTDGPVISSTAITLVPPVPPPPPQINSLSPSSGTYDQVINVSGNHFIGLTGETQVKWRRNGATIGGRFDAPPTATSAKIIVPRQSSGMTAGTWNVTLVTSSGESNIVTFVVN